MSKPINDPMDKSLFLDIPEMAKQLRCSERHLSNLRKRGEIPQPVTLGARVLWPRKTVEEWANAGCPALAV